MSEYVEGPDLTDASLWVYNARMSSLNNDYSPLSRDDYLSDEAYREALVGQYNMCREQKFQYTVENEAMKAYNVAFGENKKAGVSVQNRRAWGGYSETRIERDSCYREIPNLASAINGSPLVEDFNGECCAISSTSYTQCISDRMGYQGRNNLIVGKSRWINGDVGRENNGFSANWIHYMDSIPPQYTSATEGSVRPGGHMIGDMTLNEAVSQGIIDPGDEFSIRISAESEDRVTSGCHAMFLVSVDKDSAGNVVSYTLGGNNPPTLEVIDPNNNDSKINGKINFGSRSVVSVVHTADWVREQDARHVENMSIEELEAAVSSEMSDTRALIGDMRITEEQFFANDGHEANINLARSLGYGEHYLEQARGSREYLINQNQPIASENADDVAGHMLKDMPTLKASPDDIVDVYQEPELTDKEQSKRDRDLKRAKRKYGEDYWESMGFSVEERQDIETTMEEQRVDAERQVEVNAKLIDSGVYGNSGEGQRIESVVDERSVVESTTENAAEVVQGQTSSMPLAMQDAELDR